MSRWWIWGICFLAGWVVGRILPVISAGDRQDPHVTHPEHGHDWSRRDDA